MADTERSLISKIKKLLQNFPCVVLVGARQVGKTTLLKQILPQANFYDLEKESDRKIISSDSEYFFSNAATPLIIDEAQIEPQVFESLRVVIDENRKKNGRYLLSGSSSPDLLKNISESLAGRVAIVEVPSFDWQEAYARKESNFAKSIFDIHKLEKLKAKTSHDELLELCLYGTYPEAFLSRKNEFKYQSWLDNYIKTYIERDIRALFPSLNLNAYKRFISMLAFSSGDILNNAKFASSLSVSEPTVKKYLEIAEGTFLFRRLNAFQSNKKKTLIKSPKGYLKDTGLLNYFLKIQDKDQLLSHPHYGQIWEAFVIEQITKGLERHQFNLDYYFYRSKNRVEVDFLIDSPKALLPIEIKSGTSTDLKDLSHLHSIIEEFNCPYGIVINNSPKLIRLSETIIQVPASYI